MEKDLELYLHIPFCVRKCEYCDFLSGPAKIDRQKAYTEALLEEILHTDGMEDYRVSSIFIGGGTPSILPGEWMEYILDAVRDHFFLDAQAEVSIEANPGTVDKEKLRSYLRAGINRISFGCQSADDRELKLLGRIHSWSDFVESYGMAREAGFGNINVDLMSGLPGQSLESWERSLHQTAKLGPEHISAYSLIIEEGTPFAGKPLALPSEETERVMYERTHEILDAYGYHQYEISNYAKEGRECSHNMGYWKRREYLGLGLGSASLIGDIRFSNTRDMDDYLANSGRPEAIRVDKETLNQQAQMEEFMFLGLRMKEGIKKADFKETFGVPVEEIYGDVIAKYERMGFLETEGGSVRLTRAGISVSNPILAEFLL